MWTLILNTSTSYIIFIAIRSFINHVSTYFCAVALGEGHCTQYKAYFIQTQLKVLTLSGRRSAVICKTGKFQNQVLIMNSVRDFSGFDGSVQCPLSNTLYTFNNKNLASNDV